MKEITMNSAVRKISQEFSKLRVRTRLGSNDAETDTSSESVYCPSDSGSKWSPFRRKTKLTVAKANEAWGMDGLSLGRRHSRNEDDEDLEVAERKRSVTLQRPSLNRHARSDLGTYPDLTTTAQDKKTQVPVKKPRKIRLKRHKSFTNTREVTQAIADADEKNEKTQKTRKKLKRSKSFSGWFGNKNKDEAKEAREKSQVQLRVENDKTISRQSLKSIEEFLSNLPTASNAVTLGKSLSVAVRSRRNSSNREPEPPRLDSNRNSLTRKSSSAGNITEKYNVANVLPQAKLTIYRSNSYNGRLSIYDSFGQRLSMVETDLCSTEL